MRVVLTIILLLAPAIARSQQDSAVTLQIQFPGAGSVFQAGQVIPVELAFSAPAGSYEMTTRSYDRSGRLGIEEFHLSPPGRDPLRDHYEGGIYGGFIGGGLGGTKALSVDPETMRRDLNEWVALDQPGHYSLYVTSSRVSRRDGTQFQSVTLRSNRLEFDIVEASPAWQAQTLGAAAAVLRDPASTPEEKRAAARALRYLDTPDSVRELARQVAIPGNENRWDLEAGILGSRHRRAAVAEFEAQLAAPDVAITPEFLAAFSEAKFSVEHELMPPYPTEDTQQQKIWVERRDALSKQFMQLQDELYTQAARLASSKSVAARAETVRTVLLRPARESSDVKPLNGLPEAAVVSAFANLPPQEQLNLLETFWERVKTPGIARALEVVLEHPTQDDETLRGMAIQRLFELDSPAARPYILAEIRRPQGSDREMSTALTLLPEQTLPQFDDILAKRLEADADPTMPLDARLIGRYSTAAILPRVKTVYEKSAGEWACDIEDGLVSYFLRVEPDYGLERVRAKGGKCMEGSLQVVVAGGHWSAVEPAIIARLNDTNVWTARDAAETLALYGGPKAQKALWQRVRAFHRQWADRETELVIAANTPREVNEAVSLEYGLVESLGRAQAWLLDNDQLTELESMTLGSERENVKQWHWHSPVEISLTLLFDGQLLGNIGQVSVKGLAALEAKLAQYPSGTVFHLSAFGAPERLAAVTRAIYDIASQNGLVVEDSVAR